MIPAPPHPKVSPGFCSSGEPRCDKKARLYAQGWRCPEHAKVDPHFKSIGRMMPAVPETTGGHEAAPPIESEPIIQEETRGHDDES